MKKIKKYALIITIIITIIQIKNIIIANNRKNKLNLNIELSFENYESNQKNSANANIRKSFYANKYRKEISQIDFNKLKIGMTRSDALATLKLPNRDDEKESIILPPLVVYEKIYEKGFQHRLLNFKENKLIEIKQIGFVKNKYNAEIPDKIKLIYPINKTILKTDYSSVQQIFMNVFSWFYPKGAYPMAFEIAFERTKKSGLISNYTEKTNVNFFDATKEYYSGTYQWKVRGVNKYGKGEWSETCTLIVEDELEYNIRSNLFTK